jgi:CRP-like cAMP-binding protein
MRDHISTFFRQFHPQNFQKGESLLYAHEEPRGVYFLEKGIVRQYVISAEGKELTLHLYFPGSFFPLHWALNREIPDYNLEAQVAVTVRVAPLDVFKKWIATDPQILLSIVSRLLAGLNGMAKRVEVTSLKSASARVKSILIYFSKHLGDVQKDGTIRISKVITHEEIAAFTGLTRERVSIEMKHLKETGAVDYHRGVIQVKNISSL